MKLDDFMMPDPLFKSQKLEQTQFEQKNFPEPLKVEQFLNSQSFEGSNENKETLKSSEL